MAGEISMITGLATEALPSPVAASSAKVRTQRTAQVESTATQESQAQTAIGASSAEDKKLLASHLERAQQALMAHNATFSFERDSQDGRMYLHVIDKETGEEIYRIPKNYLKNVDPHLWQSHEVDVHI